MIFHCYVSFQGGIFAIMLSEVSTSIHMHKSKMARTCTGKHVVYSRIWRDALCVYIYMYNFHIYICTTIYILPLIVTLFPNILYASITIVDHKLIIQSSILDNWEMSWQDHWIITFSTIVTVIVTMTASKVLWLVKSFLRIKKSIKTIKTILHFVSFRIK